MENITLGQIGSAILLLGSIGGVFASIHKMIKKFESMNRHLEKNYAAILCITFMMKNMPLAERLKAGDKYVQLGGNGPVKAKYEVLKEQYKKQHCLETEEEYLEFIETVHD